MAAPLLLLVRTALRRYAIRRDDLAALRLVSGAHDLAADESGKPFVAADLGALLDPLDRSTAPRRSALVVPLRRRSVALLVDAVEDLLERAAPGPLPPLLTRHLREPWSAGTLVVGEELLVLLDIRAVARSALLAAQRTDSR
jgi:chemotaxis signal transduction protein